MKNSIFKILIFFILLSCSWTVQAQSSFPASYFGEYKGVLNIFSGLKNQQLNLEFHLLPTEKEHHYQYNLVYIVNDSVRDERLYTLIFDETTQSFSIDENNGIVLAVSYIENTLYSLFEVEGALLTSILKFEKDYINFLITYAAKNKSLKTGGLSKDIPEVVSYPIGTVQTAKLMKIK